MSKLSETDTITLTCTSNTSKPQDHNDAISHKFTRLYLPNKFFDIFMSHKVEKHMNVATIMHPLISQTLVLFIYVHF